MTKRLQIIIFLIVVFLFIATTILIRTGTINKIVEAIFKQDEESLINVEVIEAIENENSVTCSIKFITNDSNEKIKSIEYPTKESEKPFIVYLNDKGKESVGIDYEVEKGRELEEFKITTTNGQVIEKVLPHYKIVYDYNGGTEGPNEEATKILTINTKIASEAPKKEGYHFCGWSENKEATVPDYFLDGEYKSKDDLGEYIKLYAVWIEESEPTFSISNDSLIGKVSEIENSGVSKITVNNTEYATNVIYLDGDIVLDGKTQIEGATLSNNVYEFGNATTDVGTENGDATNTVILKVNGHLTVNYGITLTACKSNEGYGGPKGLLIYCGGKIINNGVITMTARGAKAEGQDVYLWKNEDESYEYVPALGADGGSPISVWWDYGWANGNSGQNGTSRQTGGGGTGSGRNFWAPKYIYISAGGKGTSYSGGSGSGAANSDGADGWSVASGAGSSTGGAGGNGVVGSANTSGFGQISIGGTGNPSGAYSCYRVQPVDYVKREGTGGLLIIYADTFWNFSSITANGVASSTTGRSQGNSRVDTGGASGGGSINIFYSSILNKGEITANGGESLYGEGGCAGGAGGNGTVSIGNISSGTFVSDEI